MGLPAFKQINTNDQNLQLIQDAVSSALRPIQSSPFVGGVLLTGVVLAAGTNAIQHTLGRTPTVWVICDTNAAQTVYRTSWTTSLINLTASGAVTVSLWIN